MVGLLLTGPPVIDPLTHITAGELHSSLPIIIHYTYTVQIVYIHCRLGHNIINIAYLYG